MFSCVCPGLLRAQCTSDLGTRVLVYTGTSVVLYYPDLYVLVSK